MQRQSQACTIGAKTLGKLTAIVSIFVFDFSIYIIIIIAIIIMRSVDAGWSEIPLEIEVDNLLY